MLQWGFSQPFGREFQLPCLTIMKECCNLWYKVNIFKLPKHVTLTVFVFLYSETYGLDFSYVFKYHHDIMRISASDSLIPNISFKLLTLFQYFVPVLVYVIRIRSVFIVHYFTLRELQKGDLNLNKPLQHGHWIEESCLVGCLSVS